MIKSFSVVTDSGINGFPVGTAVTLVREAGDKLVVTNGRIEATAPKSSFTADPGVVARLQAEKQARQVKKVETQKQASIFHKARNFETARLQEKQQEELREKKRDRLKADVAALDQRIAAAENEIAEKKANQRPIRRVYSPSGTLISYQGRSMYTLSADATGLRQLVTKRDALQAELAALE